MALVFASGSRPDACAYGHSWAPGSGNLIVSWFSCDCAGVLPERSGYGHHRIRCIVPGCSSVWTDPPHVEAG